MKKLTREERKKIVKDAKSASLQRRVENIERLLGIRD